MMPGMSIYLATGLSFYMQAFRMQVIDFGVSNRELLEELDLIGMALFMVLAFFICMAAWPWLAWKIYRG